MRLPSTPFAFSESSPKLFFHMSHLFAKSSVQDERNPERRKQYLIDWVGCKPTNFVTKILPESAIPHAVSRYLGIVTRIGDVVTTSPRAPGLLHELEIEMNRLDHDLELLGLQ